MKVPTTVNGCDGPATRVVALVGALVNDVIAMNDAVADMLPVTVTLHTGEATPQAEVIAFEPENPVNNEPAPAPVSMWAAAEPCR